MRIAYSPCSTLQCGTAIAKDNLLKNWTNRNKSVSRDRPAFLDADPVPCFSRQQTDRPDCWTEMCQYYARFRVGKILDGTTHIGICELPGVVNDVHASAGNRTRVASMATRHSTTRPQTLCYFVSLELAFTAWIIPLNCANRRGDSGKIILALLAMAYIQRL